MNAQSEYVRVNATVKRSHLESYRTIITNPNISKLLNETLAEKVAHQKRMQALETLSRLGPSFPHINNPSAYIREMREEDEKWAERIGIGRIFLIATYLFISSI